MTVILLLYLVVCLIGIKMCSFHEDYISLESSNAIKGIFVGFVFFRHFEQYVELNSTWDILFNYVNKYLGQLIVVAFLFYSGYGVTRAIMRKGNAYVRSLPVQRVLKVWLHYGIAVLLFLIANWSLGTTLSLKKILLTFVCWESLGNSNWYIMAIVIAYLFSWVAFRLFSKDYKKAALVQTILTLLAIVILAKVRPSRYYNTLLCFTAGVWYGLYKEKIEVYIKKSGFRYCMSFVATSLVFLAGVVCLKTYPKGWLHIAAYELAAVAFMGLILLITMKFRINNGFIQYMGNHVFSLYILQRLPMYVLKKTTQLHENPYLFFFVTLVLTFIIAYVFDACMKRFDQLVFSPKKKEITREGV